MVGSTEGWLNLVLPLAWACVIALAVLEEPLAGDRHFWLTRPHRWPALLAAKVIFALLFVHVPFLIADGYILAAHGFPPLEYLAQLLWKQLSFAAFVTLPALALATMVRSFTHFMLGIFAIAAAAAFTFARRVAPSRVHHAAAGRLPSRRNHRRSSSPLPRSSSSGCSTGVAAPSSPAAVGIIVALLAGTLTGFVPESADYQARALLHPIETPLSLRIEPRSQPYGFYFGGASTVGIPVVLSGLPAGTPYRTAALTLTVTTPDGRRYRSTAFTPDNQFEKVQLEAGYFSGTL